MTPTGSQEFTHIDDVALVKIPTWYAPVPTVAGAVYCDTSSGQQVAVGREVADLPESCARRRVVGASDHVTVKPLRHTVPARVWRGLPDLLGQGHVDVAVQPRIRALRLLVVGPTCGDPGANHAWRVWGLHPQKT